MKFKNLPLKFKYYFLYMTLFFEIFKDYSLNFKLFSLNLKKVWNSENNVENHRVNFEFQNLLILEF